MLLEVVLQINVIIVSDTINFGLIKLKILLCFPFFVPLLLRNAFKLVRNGRHLADRRRGGVTS